VPILIKELTKKKLSLKGKSGIKIMNINVYILFLLFNIAEGLLKFPLIAS